MTHVYAAFVPPDDTAASHTGRLERRRLRSHRFDSCRLARSQVIDRVLSGEEVALSFLFEGFDFKICRGKAAIITAKQSLYSILRVYLCATRSARLRRQTFSAAAGAETLPAVVFGYFSRDAKLHGYAKAITKRRLIIDNSIQDVPDEIVQARASYCNAGTTRRCRNNDAYRIFVCDTVAWNYFFCATLPRPKTWSLGARLKRYTGLRAAEERGLPVANPALVCTAKLKKISGWTVNKGLRTLLQVETTEVEVPISARVQVSSVDIIRRKLRPDYQAKLLSDPLRCRHFRIRRLSSKRQDPKHSHPGHDLQEHLGRLREGHVRARPEQVPQLDRAPRRRRVPRRGQPLPPVHLAGLPVGAPLLHHAQPEGAAGHHRPLGGAPGLPAHSQQQPTRLLVQRVYLEHKVHSKHRQLLTQYALCMDQLEAGQLQPLVRHVLLMR
ncbi:hypothetical protein ON010_g6159 [Phytophthora cinnamomi]|nr:hypothetical protein ON010_g6159 [Phytophthora cinnamomi]